MTVPDISPTHTRRKLFGHAAAATALLALPGGHPPSSDAALLAACDEYHRAYAKWMEPWTSDAIGNNLGDAKQDALKAVVGIQHVTQEGLRAKAAVAHCEMMFDATAFEPETPWREHAIAGEVLAIDVLSGLVGRA